jgi:hypothetical protein
MESKHKTIVFCTAILSLFGYLSFKHYSDNDHDVKNGKNILEIIKALSDKIPDINISQGENEKLIKSMSANLGGFKDGIKIGDEYISQATLNRRKPQQEKDIVVQKRLDGISIDFDDNKQLVRLKLHNIDCHEIEENKEILAFLRYDLFYEAKTSINFDDPKSRIAYFEINAQLVKDSFIEDATIIRIKKV